MNRHAARAKLACGSLSPYDARHLEHFPEEEVELAAVLVRPGQGPAVVQAHGPDAQRADLHAHADTRAHRMRHAVQALAGPAAVDEADHAEHVAELVAV